MGHEGEATGSSLSVSIKNQRYGDIIYPNIPDAYGLNYIIIVLKNKMP